MFVQRRFCAALKATEAPALAAPKIASNFEFAALVLMPRPSSVPLFRLNAVDPKGRA